MRNLLILFLSLSLLAGTLRAQVIVQNGSRMNSYARLDSAVKHSLSGDTIYLSELNNALGTYYYGSSGLFINKELHIFGPGIHPDSTVASGISLLTGDIVFINGSNNSTLTGIYADNIYVGRNNSDTIKNIDISRCYITHEIYVYGKNQSYITIRQNICNKINADNGSSNPPVYCTISNNISAEIGYFSNSLIANNDLIDSVGYYGSSKNIGDLFEFTNSIVRNNIELAAKIDSNYNTSCTYKNNLTITPIQNNCASCISGSNIVQRKDSIFTKFGKYDFVSNQAQLIRYNMHLKSGCKGINAGADGTDMGIYGGLYPWKDGILPVNPHILSKTISTTLDTSKKLKVNISAEAQQK